MLENVKNFMEDLVVEEVMGVNIDEAKECLKIISNADEKLKYPSAEQVKLACEWFNDNDIDANINDRGFLELMLGDEFYVSVSNEEIDYRAELQNSLEDDKVFCANCGKEVVLDEAENCPDCGIWLGDEIREVE